MSQGTFDLQLFHDGDERAFNDLVRVHSPRLLAFLRQYAVDTTESYDLLQDLWIRAYQKRAHYRGDGAFLGWLLAIGRTVGLAAVQKRARAPVASADGVDIAVAVDEDASIDAARQQNLLRAAVAALPERQRDIVVMRIIEGRSTAETARALQCAEGTVKATLHQAIRKLHEQLAPVVRSEEKT